VSAGIRRDIVILACAVSAGIHGALVPAHFAEGTAAGVGFVVATIGLALTAGALTFFPASAHALTGAALLFGGLLVSYALAITTGLPVLHPHAEPVDGLALVTKAIEAIGLLAAWTLVHPQTKGSLTWHAHVRSPSS
jgi:hypothetical protein